MFLNRWDEASRASSVWISASRNPMKRRFWTNGVCSLDHGVFHQSCLLGWKLNPLWSRCISSERLLQTCAYVASLAKAFSLPRQRLLRLANSMAYAELAVHHTSTRTCCGVILTSSLSSAHLGVSPTSGPIRKWIQPLRRGGQESGSYWAVNQAEQTFARSW